MFERGCGWTVFERLVPARETLLSNEICSRSELEAKLLKQKVIKRKGKGESFVVHTGKVNAYYERGNSRAVCRNQLR